MTMLAVKVYECQLCHLVFAMDEDHETVKEDNMVCPNVACLGDIMGVGTADMDVCEH